MNLSDNLKKIRKEHNLSQEQLAEQLGVSRQSVSKWESGSAYPEMDKMLQLCQIFNLNIDELLNQDVKEVNNTKQSKNNINKFIDDFLDYITKTIDMFGSMNFKEKMKCLFEQSIIILSLIIILSIIGLIGSEILGSLISFLPNKVYYPVFHIFKAIYITACLILSIAIIFHIFKVRYLDYYVVVKNKKTNNEDKEKNVEEVVEVDDKIFSEKEQKVIIRDPEHSGYKFISGLLKCLLFFIKFIYVCIEIAFCFSLIAFIIALVLSFSFIKTGMFFIGILLFLISCIIVNVIILIFIYNLIISRKNKKDKMAIAFLLAVVVFGIGIGYTVLGISKFEIITNIDSNYYLTEEKEYKMTDDLFFKTYLGNIEYIESENKDVKVVYKYSSIYDMEFIDLNNGYYITTSLKDYNELELVRKIIDDFNEKKIIDYSDFKISIYTTKENIEILNSNLEKYYDSQEENHIQKIINDYENKINELNKIIDKKTNEIHDLENNCNID